MKYSITSVLMDFSIEPENVIEPETDVLQQPYYSLTEQERNLLHQAVMAEAMGESFEGQMMVAQCILDGADRNGFDITTSIRKYKIATTNIQPTQSVIDAVSAVFDDGQRITEAKADLWYAPHITYSSWHEKQQYICTIGVHKFFWCNSNIN